MSRPVYDMLLEPTACADCGTVMARGELCWLRPVQDMTGCVEFVCASCAKAQILPDDGPDDPFRDERVRW